MNKNKEKKENLPRRNTMRRQEAEEEVAAVVRQRTVWRVSAFACSTYTKKE